MKTAHIAEMDRILHGYKERANLLDVGSFDVNGSFRPLVTGRGWQYTGVDIVEGRNVDVVSEDPYRFPFDDGAFDVVISGSCMEHVEAIWLWVPELVRLVRPGGLVAIITHHAFPFHQHPVDCWRVMPDGFRYLFNQTGVLERYDVRMFNEQDISGAAWKVMA